MLSILACTEKVYKDYLISTIVDPYSSALPFGLSIKTI